MPSALGTKNGANCWADVKHAARNDEASIVAHSSISSLRATYYLLSVLMHYMPAGARQATGQWIMLQLSRYLLILSSNQS